MKEIDFLPSRYSEQNARRKARLWLLGVLSLFGIAISLAAAGQYAVRRGLKQELQAAAARSAAAATKYAQIAQLQRDLDHARDVAALYTYLQHPWPRTRLLAEIVEPLPATMALTGLTIARDAAAPRAVFAPPEPASEDSGEEEIAPARRDLNHLRQKHDQHRAVISLSGVTRDHADLHSYVAQLGRSPMFEAAELESLESLSQDNLQAGASFLVRVVVRPGYGQPQGPQGERADESLASASAPRERT